MDNLNELQNTVHQYRKALDAFESRTGHQPQQVEARGSGEEREKIAHMDADLSVIEARAESAALRARIAKLESQPMFQSAAPSTLRGGDPNDRGSEAYAARWLNAVIRGDHAEMRVLTVGTTSAAAIPTDLERRIVNRLQQANVLRGMCPVNTIDSKRTIAVENALPSTNLVTENNSITPSDPSFNTQISVTPYKYVTATSMSQEYIEDAIGTGGIGSGLAYVADKLGLSIGLAQEEAYTVGTNSSQPQGIAGSSARTTIAGISQVTDLATQAVTTVTGDNLIDTVHLVAPQYRNSPRFSWLISDTLLKTVRKIKTASGATDYVWKVGNEGGLTNGAPGTIYGVPYRVGQYVPTATVADNVFAVVGDFNYFEIFDRTGITSMMDPYSGASTHKTTLYVYTRTDSKLMLGNAFAMITC